MIFNSWLRSLRNRSRRSIRRAQRRSPQAVQNARQSLDELEILEDRTLLTIQVNFASVIAGLSLQEVNLTDDADQISITQNGNSLIVALSGTDDATGLPARFGPLSSNSGNGLTYFNGLFVTANPANADRLAIALGASTLGRLNVSTGNRDDSIDISNVNLSLSDVQILGGQGTDNLTIGNSGFNLGINNGSDLTINSVEAILQQSGGVLDVSGNTDITLTNGLVQLDQADNDFGGTLVITADGSDVRVRDANALSVNNIRADILQVTAPSGLSQDTGSTINVQDLTLDSANGDVLFNNIDNSIPRVQVTRGQNVIVANTLATSTTISGTNVSTGDFTLTSSAIDVNGVLTVGGNLTLDASSGIGPITDGFNARITVAGSTSLSVDPLDDVILDAVTFAGANAHDFHGPGGTLTISDATNVNIRHRGNLNFIVPTVSGTLTLSAEAAGGESGDITDDIGTQSITVAGLTTLDADGDITLDLIDSNYSSLRILSARNADILDTRVEDGLRIAGAAVSQSLTVNTTGGLFLTGDVLAGQDISLTAGESSQMGGPDILTDDLTFSANVVLSSVAGNISLNIADDIVMQASNIISASNGIRDVVITLDNPGVVIEPSGTNTLVQGIVRAAFLQIAGGDDSDIIEASGITTAATIVGGGGDDSIIGTEADDSLMGDAGDDTIIGGHGNDILLGGDDNDLLIDGAGGDTLTSGLGNDEVRLRFEAPDTTVTVDVNTGDGDDVVQISDSGIPFTSGHLIRVDTGLGDDSILAEPIFGATINAIDGNGHTPTGGDSLLLNLTNPQLMGFTPVSPAAPSGTVTPTNTAFGAITYTNIEKLIFNSDTTPSYNANGRIVNEASPNTGGFFSDGTKDDFSVVVLSSGIVQVTVNGTLDEIPINGIQKLSVTGSNDIDLLAMAQLPFNVDFTGGSTSARDQLYLTANPSGSDVTFRPSAIDPATGQFELTDGVFTFEDGSQLTISAVELTLAEDFQTFLLQPSVSQNTLVLDSGDAGTNQAEFGVFSPTLNLTTTSASEGVRLLNIVNLTLDLGVSDGAQPNDAVTINNNALRTMPTLASLTISTGSGNDRVIINDGNFYLGNFNASNPGGVFTIDGGAATDTIAVIASNATLDTEETDIRFELQAVTNTNALLTSRSLSIASTISLRNFIGEEADLTGNATDNVFDLQGWNQLGTARISGGGGLDTLIALDNPGTTNTWNITGLDSGDVGGFTFDQVETLTGGTSANDRYIFTTAGMLTGTVAGAGGTDTLDFSAYLSAITFSILFTSNSGFQGALLQNGSTAVINGGFTGIDRLIGGANSKDELHGLDQNARWEIDVTNQLIHLAVPPRTLDFSGIEILTGGAASDDFFVTGTQANSIVGGAGNDTLRFANEASRLIGGFTGGSGTDVINLSTYSSPRDVTLLRDMTQVPDLSNPGLNLLVPDGFTGTEAAISEGFTGVDTIVGGLAINDTLRGISNVISLWTISARDSGSYVSTQTGQTLQFGEPTGTFGFENLVGGTQQSNTFQFTNNGSSRGTLSGGAAFDTIIGDSTRLTTEFTVDGVNTGRIDSGGLSVAVRFDSVETLTGGAQADTFMFTNSGSLQGPIDGGGGIDKLIGDNDGNQFVVHTKDTGTIAGKANTLGLSVDGSGRMVDFANIETLQGGSGVDTFLIDAILVGDAIGQSGNDEFRFTTNGIVLGSVQGGVGTDTLIGDDDGNIFDITGSVSGSTPVAAVGRGQVATKTSLFTGVENLIGGTGADEFNFVTLGSVTGFVDGAGGTNTVTGDSDGNIFTVTTPDAGLLFGKTASFSHIQNLVGGDASDSFNVSSTLSGNITGLVGADTVVVAATGVVMGNIATNESDDSIDIRGVVNGTISGGLGNDTITLQQINPPSPGAQVNGQINGDGDDDVFNITGIVTLGQDLLGGTGNDRFVFENAGSLNVAINGGSGSDTLEGDDDGNAFTVDNPNQGTLPGKVTGSFLDIENLVGGDGSDTFLVAGLGSLSGSVSGGAGDDSVTVESGRTISGSVSGDAGNDTFTIRDTARVLGAINGGDNNDTLNLNYSGGDTRSFTFNGGLGTDILNLTGGVTGATGVYSAGTVAGSGQYITTNSPNSQTVNFTGLEPISDSQVLAALTINGSGGNDTINIVNPAVSGFAGYTEVNFNGSFSPIRFLNKGTVNVDGQGGNDTLNVNTVGGSVGLVINVNGDNKPGDAVTVGAAGADTINLNVSHTGSHSGGAGNDTFVLQPGVVLAGSIAGNAGTDTLNAGTLLSDVTVTLTGRSVTDGFDGTVTISPTNAFTFTDLDSMQSGSGNDTLANGQLNAADWELDGTNRFITSVPTVDDFAFSSFENLTGGDGVDVFAVSGSRTLNINGGSGDDTLLLNAGAVLNGPFNAGSGNDTLDLSPVNNASVSVSLTQAAVVTNPPALPVIDGYDGVTPLITGGFQFVNSFIGGSSLTAIDTFSGFDSTGVWTITPTTSTYQASGSTGSFRNFETASGGGLDDTFSINGTTEINLNGGNGNDVFNIQDGAVPTGTIDGGNHTTEDRVDYSAYTTPATAFADQFVNIESLIGSMDSNDSLLGSNGNDLFTINSANAGVFVGPTGHTLNFRNWENVNGRGGSDQFVFSTNLAQISGIIAGGSTVDADTLNVSGVTTPIGFTLSGIGTFDGFNGNAGALASSFTDIDELVGGSSGTDSLTGLGVPATWTVAPSGTYASSGRQVSFSAIENLNGGAGIDTFNITGSVTANLNANGGNDIVSVATSVILTGTVSTGTENDRVALAQGASITGIVDGGAGIDTLDYSARTAPVTVTLAAAGANDYSGTATSLGAGFDSFDAVIGSSVAGDTLNGRNANSTWTVSGTSSYAPTSGGASFGFSSVEVLNGGSADDIFNVSGLRTADLLGNGGNDLFHFADNAARLTGRIAGGTGANSLDFAGFTVPSPTAAAVTLTGNSVDGFAGQAQVAGVGTALISGGFTEIANLAGGSGIDTLTGQNVKATWLITTGGESYLDESTSRVLNYASFENLAGGNDKDDFVVAGTHTGSLSGGTGGDVIDIQNGGVLTGNIFGNSGNDEIFVAAGATLNGGIDSGDGDDLVSVAFNGLQSRTFQVNVGVGNDELRLSGGELMPSQVSSVEYELATSTLRTTVNGIVQSISFSGIDVAGVSDSLNDRQIADEFIITGTVGPETISLLDDMTNFSRLEFVGIFVPVTFQNKTTLTINGGANNDHVILNSNSVPGATGLSLIQVSGDDGDDRIDVLMTLDGAGGRPAGHLIGGNGNDTFLIGNGNKIDDGVGGSGQVIEGGTGTDTLDLSAWQSELNLELIGNAADGFSGVNLATQPLLQPGKLFVGIDSIVGGSATTDGLKGHNTVATWELDGSNRYIDSVTGRSLGFSGFESLNGNDSSDTFQISGARTSNLTGGAGDDVFAFVTDDARLTGGIEGTSGVDTINFSGITTTAVAVLLDGVGDSYNGQVSGIVTTGFLAIDVLVGGGGGNDRLTGRGVDANWDVNAAGSQYREPVSTRTLGFSQFENLQGGAGVDSFTITGAVTANLLGGDNDDLFSLEDGATLIGTIDGGSQVPVTGQDRVDFSAYTTSVQFSTAQLVNIETLLDSGESNDTLLGSGSADTFTITDANTGNVSVSGGTSLHFQGWENLDGGAGSDTFIFDSNSSMLTGTVNGGATGESDALRATGVSSAVSFILAGTGPNSGFRGTAGALFSSFTNIDTLAGGLSASDSLTGLDAASNWTVASAGNYSSGGRALPFSSIESLIGGNQADAFTVSGNVTVIINGNDGADTVTLNSSAALTGSVTTGAGDDVITLRSNAMISGSVDAGAGSDTLSFTGSTSAFSLALTGPNAGASGFNGDFGSSGPIGGSLGAGVNDDVLGIESLIGGSGFDQLTGLNTVSTWTIATTSTYFDTASSRSLSFSGIDNAVGGSLVDTFNVNATAFLSLSGGDGNDDFNFNSGATITGTANGGNGDDTFDFAGLLAAPLPEIDGGAHTTLDIVNFSAALDAVAVDAGRLTNIENVLGTNLSDTLLGTTGADVFAFTTQNPSDTDGTLNSTLAFMGFENFDGGSGNDQFQFANGVGVPGTVSGGAGTDTVDYSAYTSAVSVDLALGTSQNVGMAISSIENATGGSGDDTLTGSSGPNALVGGAGADRLADGLGNDMLTGGTGDDVYLLTPGGADVVDESSGSGNDRLDFSTSAGPITIDLDSTAAQFVLNANTLQLSGVIENFTGSAGADLVTASGSVGTARQIVGGGGNDTFTQSNPVVTAWTISGFDAGTVGTIAFSSFENLQGSAGNDIFSFLNQQTISGTIDGGAGTLDELNYSAYTTLAVQLDLAKLVNIEVLQGSALPGDTLLGLSTGNVFNVSGVNSGTANGIAFSGFENLTGAAGTDTFNFSSSGRVTGTSDGGSGVNSLNLSANDDIVELTGTGATTGLAGKASVGATQTTLFTNITSLDTAAGTLDSLTGLNSAATWDINDTRTYQTLGRNLVFANVELGAGGSTTDAFNITGAQSINLSGAGGDDAFTLHNGASLTGTADGGTGSNDRVVYEGTAPQVVSLSGLGSIDGFNGSSAGSVTSFQNIDSIQGGAGSDSLLGLGLSSTWTLNATTGNTYQASGRSLKFGSIQVLTGGAGADTFNVTGSNSVNVNAGAGDDRIVYQANGAAITGSVDGGSHSVGDVLDYSALTAGVSISLATISNFETLTGSLGSDTILGTNGADAFLINGINAGVVGVLRYTGVEVLDGAAGNDTFDYDNGASEVSVIGGPGTDIVDLRDYTSNRSVTLTGRSSTGFTGSDTGAGAFTGIDTILAPTSQTGDQLTGLNDTATWQLGAATTYTVSGQTLDFSGFNALNGDAGADTFNVTANSALTLNGGAGNDRLAMASGTTLTGTFSGGSGTDTVDLSTRTSPASVTVLATGATDGFNIATGSVTGNASSVDAVIATSGVDTITGLNVASTWSIGSSGSYNASGRSLALNNFEIRNGGSGADVFNIQANGLLSNATHVVNGNAGDDTFNVNFAAGTSLGASATLQINGGTAATVDRVNLLATAAGDGARTVGIDHGGAIDGNVSVTGLGGAAPIALTGVEGVGYSGDAANNDSVTVNATPNNDVVTLRAAASGAQFFFGGATDYVNPGVAGGSLGPDVTVLGAKATGGVVINGGNQTTADRLLIDNGGLVTPLSANSGTITGTGLAAITYQDFENLDSDEPIGFTLNAGANANNGTADDFRVELVGGSTLQVSTQSGSNILLSLNSAKVNALVINGSGDDDHLTVDLTNGDAVPSVGITFNGGGQVTRDDLVVIGAGGEVGAYTPSATTFGNGVVVIDGSPINFTGLEPVTVSNMASFTFVSPNGSDVINVGSPAAGQNILSGTSGGVSFESLAFSSITSFTIDTSAGTASDSDSVTFASDLVATGLTGFTVTTGSGADTVDAALVTSLGVTLNGGAGDDTLTGTVQPDQINGGTGFDQLVVSSSVGITLTDSTVVGDHIDAVSGFEQAVLIAGPGDDVVDASAFTGSGGTIQYGNDGNDSLIGSAAADILLGGSGDDTMIGNAGDDSLLGSSGSDYMDGGAGNDQLRGQGTSRDVLIGGTGDDDLDGGAGNDIVLEYATAGFTLTDTILTGNGTDKLTDIQYAELFGGEGGILIDARSFTGIAVILRGGSGNDTLLGSSGRDVLYGDAGNDVLRGFAGIDFLMGAAGADLLDGGDGDDFLRGQGGSHDSLYGGAGNDKLDGGAGTDFVFETADTDFTLTDRTLTGVGNDKLFFVEIVTLTGGAGNNRIDASGSSLLTVLNGRDGNDTLLGGSSADVINGEAGADAINGGDGNDTVDAGAGNDTLEGGAGVDLLVIATGGDQAIRASTTVGSSTDTFSGFEGARLTGDDGPNVLDASLATIDVTLLGGGGDDTLIGGSGNDVIDGGTGTDILTLAGANIVLTNAGFSGTGADQVSNVEGVFLMAGPGNSRLDASGYTLGPVTLLGGDGDDTLLGGTGNDSIQGNLGNDFINGGAGNDVLGGGGGDDSILGGAGNDQLIGNSGNDTLRGEAGNDTLEGDDGNDLIFGGDGDDVGFGGNGNDGMNGGAGNDIFAGDHDDDTILGSTGDDTLGGGAGNDILIGGAGNDALNGNGGTDTMAGGVGTDTITGFASEIDEAFTEGFFPFLL